jgi:hypothetical protein
MLRISLALLLPFTSFAADALLVKASTLEYPGDWQVVSQGGPVRQYLEAPSAPVSRPAVGAIQITAAGQWRLWVRSKDYPHDRPGIRNYRVRLGNQRSATVFGRHGQEGMSGWEWEDGGVFDLPAGPLLLVVGEDGKPNSRCDALLLTRDLDYHPSGMTERLNIPRAVRAALAIRNLDAAHAPLPPVTDVSPTPTATLENHEARFAFHQARSDGKTVFILRTALDADASAETYRIVYRPRDKPAKIQSSPVHPKWDLAYSPKAEVSAGGASVITVLGSAGSPWTAGELFTLRPTGLRIVDRQTLELQFPPVPAGQLTATWHLAGDMPAAQLTLHFKTAQAGQFSLGYHAPVAGAPEKMDFLLLPFLVHGRRLPAQEDAVLDARTPTPLTLVNQHSVSLALVADPENLSGGWPSAPDSRYAFAIRNEAAQAQPIVYSPVLGLAGSSAETGATIENRVWLWVQPGPWHQAYERIVQQLFGLRDYRRPVYGSLSDAVLNLYDLLKSGLAWDDRAKGPWNIESRNTVTQSSPLAYMSLYLLTGDEAFYRRFALPSLEFLLSRQSPHFAAAEPYGDYVHGEPLSGPSTFYGATTWASAFAMTQGRTRIFGELSHAPDGSPRVGKSGGHLQPFEDALALYHQTGDKKWLAQAITGADHYIDANLKHLPTADLGVMPFVNASFVPDWEGLLHLYEATGEQRFLDASAEGARWLLTTLWVHPVVKAGEQTLHPGNTFDGERHLWYFGDSLYRLGLYDHDDGSVQSRGMVPPAHLPEQKVPAWQVSNVGLGLEQPVTYSQPHGDNHIMMSIWAPNLLRLANLTHDELFRTAARNATIGRFTNYPGYYVNGYTNVEQQPDYPTKGPDVTSLYYHHIPTFTAYLIDYLFTDAEMRSHGNIVFPAVRQDGYVWFDSRLYGHAPGKIYGQTAWPWLHRTAASVDNINVDRILAHGEGKFYVVLLNQTPEPQKVTVHFDRAVLGYSSGNVTEYGHGILPMKQDRVAVTLPASGITTLILEGVHIDVPTHRIAPAASAETSTIEHKPIPGTKLEATATVIDAPPFTLRDLYVYVAAGMHECSAAKLIYRAGSGPEQQATVNQFPCEFTVRIEDTKSPIDWRVELPTR